jgi:hypothetical protein
MNEPQDHKPAAQREAEGDQAATLTWRDMSFTVPADVDDLDGDFVEAAENGKSAAMIRLILGGKQFSEFKAAKPKVRDYKQLGDQIASLYGFEDAGN